MNVLCHLRLCRHSCAVCGRRSPVRATPHVSFTAPGKAAHSWYGHQRCLDAIREVLALGPSAHEGFATAVPQPAPKPPCTGFHWIGQPFYCCDNCSRPAWEHEGMHTFDRISGPFGTDPGHTEPWKPGEADRMRVKWEPGWHVANGCSHLGKWLHGPTCPAAARVVAGQDGTP